MDKRKVRLSKAEFKYLNQVRAEMQTQNNRMTSHVMFVVFGKEPVVVEDGYDVDRYVYVERITGDNCEFDSEDEAQKWLRDYLDDGAEMGDCAFQTACEAHIERLAIKDVDRFIQIFFTESAAKHYIDTRGHHLNKPYIYGVSAYDNYELVAVQRLLLDGLNDHANGVYA